MSNSRSYAVLPTYEEYVEHVSALPKYKTVSRPSETVLELKLYHNYYQMQREQYHESLEQDIFFDTTYLKNAREKTAALTVKAVEEGVSFQELKAIINMDIFSRVIDGISGTNNNVIKVKQEVHMDKIMMLGRELINFLESKRKRQIFFEKPCDESSLLRMEIVSRSEDLLFFSLRKFQEVGGSLDDRRLAGCMPLGTAVKLKIRLQNEIEKNNDAAAANILGL